VNVLPDLVSAWSPEPAMLRAPGGFTWWYADLVDGEGRAFVLIVAYGLPFLPGYVSAARSGHPELPLDRPSIVLSAVEDGRPWFWSVTELRPGDLEWRGDELRSSLGRVRIRQASDSRAAGAGFELDADLRGELGGCEWTASVQIRGRTRSGGSGEPVHAAHEWNVLGLGEGTVVLTSGGRTFRLRGRAYVDRNASDAPLHLATSSWCWGRVALPGRDLIWYTADSGGRTVSIDQRTTVGPPAEITTWRVGRWGQWVPAGVALEGGGVSLRPFDDSPFYTRFLAEGTIDGERAYGVAEWCVPSRIDAGWMRPLVRMAVPVAASAGSKWLPLLAGPAHGRIGRTARRWLQ
jgi:carotenoid 1,2-hydratase